MLGLRLLVGQCFPPVLGRIQRRRDDPTTMHPHEACTWQSGRQASSKRKSPPYAPPSPKRQSPVVRAALWLVLSGLFA